MSSNEELGKIHDVHIECIKTVYVAGPFIGKTPWETHKNTRLAEEFSAKIWGSCAFNVLVISPHLNTKEMVGVAKERAFVTGYLRAIDISDAVFVLPGWQDSRGTKGEIVRAYEKRKPIFFDIDSIINWVNHGLGEDPNSSLNYCNACNHTMTASDYSWLIARYSLCDECLKNALDNARYRPHYLVKIMESR